ncbi:MAG: peptide deformylase [Bacteroidales bacterium]|nr:peptide deformylase [Bacteroidales bacterium]
MKKTVSILICVVAVAAVLLLVFRRPFSKSERALILESDSLMYVLTMPQDSAVLRAQSRNFTRKELRSDEAKELIAKMLYTVQDPSQDGVGIAAPQVGLNLRAICVCRLDKIGAPFEAYLNVKIDSLGGTVQTGPEGCLSIPGYRGMVKRHNRIKISYVNPQTLEKVSEDIEGFTAVIFQHEVDHLDGILYTDRADTVYVSQ